MQSVAHTQKEISETIVSVAWEHASCAVQVQFFVSGGHFPVCFSALEFFLKRDSSVLSLKNSETRITVDILKQEPKIKG